MPWISDLINPFFQEGWLRRSPPNVFPHWRRSRQWGKTSSYIHRHDLTSLKGCVNEKGSAMSWNGTDYAAPTEAGDMLDTRFDRHGVHALDHDPCSCSEFGRLASLVLRISGQQVLRDIAVA